ncbi:MAG: Hsp70 family protein [Deltaproteobacteria bacterium]|nr:Hsp70 family protein [Deltaproteobacteria bacterium]
MSPPEPRKPLPRSLSWADALFGDTEQSPTPDTELPDLPIELPVEETGPLGPPERSGRRLGRRNFRRGLSLAPFRQKGRNGVLALAGGLRTPVLPKRARPSATTQTRANNTGPLDPSALEDTDLMEIEASEIEALDAPVAAAPRSAEALSVEESLAAMLGSELPTGSDTWSTESQLSDEASGITLVRALTLEDVVSSPAAAVAQTLPSIPPPLPKARVEVPHEVRPAEVLTSPPSPMPLEVPITPPITPPIEVVSPPLLPRVPQPRSPSLPPIVEVRSSAPRAPSLPPIIETNSAPPRQPSLIPEVRTPAPRSPSLPPIVEARSTPPRAPSLVPEARAPLPRAPSLPPTRNPSGASDRPTEAVSWQPRKWPAAGPKGEVVVGVDLGTTYSAVAIAEGDEVRVLSTRRGLPTLPSAVAYEASGRALLGDAALRFLPSNPGATIVGWKRLLGRTFDSPIVEEVKRHFAYEITPNAEGNAAVRVHGQVVDLEAVAAEILDELRVAASMQLEGKVNRAVITCPAHFGEAQRAAIRRAGELAGFHVERVLSEPTAAALAYGFGKGFDGKRLLVYDLGGGTFDVSLLVVRGETYEVIATGGDSFLGGLDFDATIVRLLVEALQAQEGIDARTDPAAIAKLMQYAERAKRELSTRESTIIEVEHLVVQPHAARSLTLAVKRAQVEKLFSPIIDHTLEIVQDVCQRAGLQPKEVDEVVLVGGQTRTPIIARKVRSMLGKDPRTGIDPDEAVALGAARFAQGLLEKSDVKLVDALPVSIGVGLPGGRFHKLIQRDTPLPASHLHTLRTTRDNQPSLELFFFQGEADQAEHNDPLGSLVLSGLPRGPKGTVVVEVRLRVDEEQVLSVTAKEQKSGKSIETKFGTKTTPAELRSKLGLPPEPSHEDLQKRRYQVGRPKGVWGWISKVLGR